MITAGILSLGAIQFCFAASAQADSLSGLSFDGPWPAGYTSILPPNDQTGHAFQVDRGGTVTPSVDANALVVYSKEAPTFGGAEQPGLPVDVTVVKQQGSCVPVATTAAGTAVAFMCDLEKSSYASFGENIGAATPDRSTYSVSVTVVPHSYTTLAQVEAAERSGQKFLHESDSTVIESRERAAKDHVAEQLHGFATGQTSTETASVRAADDGTVAIWAESGTPGVTWRAKNSPPVLGQIVALPPGLTVTSVSLNGGGHCTMTPVALQNSNSGAGTNPGIARCAVTPRTTMIKVTFAAAASLPTTAVKLHTDYDIYSNTFTPISSAVGIFTIHHASTSATSGGASPGIGPAGSSGATQLASTGASSTGWIALSAFLLLLTGVGTVGVSRRRKSSV